MEDNLANWNILVADGKKSKRDSLSSGERTEISPNLFYLFLWKKGAEGISFIFRNFRRNSLIKLCTIDGDSPVIFLSLSNKGLTRQLIIPSIIGCERVCENLRGPPRKTKYFFMTDSVLVLWRNGEKRTPEGEWKERETVICQPMEGLTRFWPCACWRMSRRLIKRSWSTILNIWKVWEKSILK